MNKIVLVRPVCSTISEPELPLNLMILAASLEREGYNPIILDYDAIKLTKPEIVDSSEKSTEVVGCDIISYSPKYVFFTCMCSNFARTISIIKYVKLHYPKAFIGIGGPHVSMCAKDTMNAYHKFIDAVLIGEGEKTIVEIIKGVESNSIHTVNGICYYEEKPVLTSRRELLQNLDDSPIPAYHLIDMEVYGNMTGKTNVYVGSGCPFACNFCTTSLMWERRYRAKSVERVIQELDILVNKYGKKDFVFIHDNLTANRDYALELINAIKRSGLVFEYEISSRIDTIDEELIRLFAESGGKTIFFGIETGSEKMQQLIGKRLKLSRIHEILEACKSNNAYAAASFIIGFPSESLEDMEKTINLSFICRTLLEDQVGMNLLSIYPGSPLSKEAYNELYLDEINYEFPMYQGLSEEEICDIKKYKSIYIHYYLYKKYSNGLSPIEMRKLFDYVTIILEKYPFTFNYLLNCLHMHFTDIFLRECYTMDNLSLEDKDSYNYKIDVDMFVNDIRDMLPQNEIETVREWLLYDESVETIYRLSLNNSELYHSSFSIKDSAYDDEISYSYYIVVGKNGDVYNLEVSKDIYLEIKEIEDSASKLETYLNNNIGLQFG